MTEDNILKMILPKGRIQEKVLGILARIGTEIGIDGRSYRPGSNDPTLDIKLLKPQNIPLLVALGRHDCGFTGHDWVIEQNADVVELLDLGFDPIRLVAAVPEELVASGKWRERRIIVASEYRNLTERFIEQQDLKAVFVQTYGATEALPPEDADLIIDNTATGATLRRNRLIEVETLMHSSTRFICNSAALEDRFKRRKLEEMTTLLRSALMADQRVLLEMNVSPDQFEQVIDMLPCMRSPTVSPLHAEQGFAVKAAVPTKNVRELIPRLIEAGATDILEYRLEKIVDTDSLNSGGAA